MYEDVTYETCSKIDPDELLGFYTRQQHQTTQVKAKLERMMEHTFCFVVARRGGELIGMARGVTDGVRGQLAECKLDPSFQGPACITRTDGRIEHDNHGIAKVMATRVIAALRDQGVERVSALAYGTEVDFCEELDFRKASGVVVMQLDLGGDAPTACGGEA